MSTPTLPTDHEDYEALAVAWAVNALDPADQEVFEAHRDRCERCARAARAALEIAAELAHGVPDVAPPPRLRAQVLAAALQDPPNKPGRRAAEDDNQSAARSSGRPTAGDNRRYGKRLAGPATAEGDGPSGARAGRRLTAGGDSRGDGRAAGAFAGRRPSGRRASGRRASVRRPRETGAGRPARELRGPRRLVYALAAAVLVAGSAITAWEVTRPAAVADRIAAISAGHRTVATVVAHQHGVDVVTDVLRPNTGRDTAYYLWGVPAGDGGTPQVVGTFRVTASGLHSYPLRVIGPLDGYPAFAISEEKAGSTPSAPSSVLGKGAVGG